MSQDKSVNRRSRFLLLLVVLVFTACCGLFLFNFWQYREAHYVLKMTRDMEVGAKLSQEEIRDINKRRCQQVKVSPNSNIADADELQFNCRLILIHVTGLEERELEVNLVVGDGVLLRKIIMLYYGDRRGIGVSQQVRGFGYEKAPEPSIPNRWIARSHGITMLREDNQLSAADLYKDWDLPLDCLWRRAACDVLFPPD